MRKKVVGKVISDKMQKTRVVISETLRKHPLYKKYYRHRTKYYVHDEKEESREGDVVLIEETRPISKLKRWRLVKIIKKAEK
ncbi:MAG: 30S ribosomal protein S17 [Candidatus Pacebacteria bacterium]|jgi:small subunit ribosomal protein S17|nr:30S ribosomal protein S17 [Candidatus Paceibacterota bacterium]